MGGLPIHTFNYFKKKIDLRTQKRIELQKHEQLFMRYIVEEDIYGRRTLL